MADGQLSLPFPTADVPTSNVPRRKRGGWGSTTSARVPRLYAGTGESQNLTGWAK